MTAEGRRLLGPSLMTAAMLLVLLGLGSWQVKRLFWKQALLADIAHAEAAPPVPLAADRGAPGEFTKVVVSGEFLPAATALYGAEVKDLASGPALGARLIEPLRENNGDVILVDRGWVPEKRAVPLDHATGEISVSGYIRHGDKPGWFSAADDLAARHFFTLDPRVIGEAVGQPNARPFVLVALAGGPPPGPIVTRFPDPARHLPRPPNNHLSYAITWYGLAVALLATFIGWARKGSRA